MDKKEARKFYKKIRESIPENIRLEKSDKIANFIAETEAFKNCDTLLIYISVGSEVGTKSLILKAFELGKKVSIPVIKSKEMEFAVIKNSEELVPGAYGIPTAPDNSEILKNFDNALCVLPCLSADLKGFRLGYGGGYYDRFLSSHPYLYKLCVCFDECVTETLPTESLDVKFDLCITDKKSFGGV